MEVPKEWRLQDEKRNLKGYKLKGKFHLKRDNPFSLDDGAPPDKRDHSPASLPPEFSSRLIAYYPHTVILQPTTVTEISHPHYEVIPYAQAMLSLHDSTRLSSLPSENLIYQAPTISVPLLEPLSNH